MQLFFQWHSIYSALEKVTKESTLQISIFICIGIYRERERERETQDRMLTFKTFRLKPSSVHELYSNDDIELGIFRASALAFIFDCFF